jgi:5-formyltetrahydrofolate cyclo-ligase
VSTQSDTAKQAVRESIWAALEREREVHPPGAHGRIPHFIGAEAAADRLAALPVWQVARVIKANPDRAQLPVRVRALAGRKLLYMAVPKLADRQPFYLLDPDEVTVSPSRAASSEGASRLSRKVGVRDLQPVDIIICGSVAVNRNGVRIGKGGGYADLEVALMAEAGLIGEHTTIVTTVHPLQVLDEPLPETAHDFSVDVIITPDEVITCGPSRRPAGLIWSHLDPEQITSIPILAARARGEVA